MVDLVSLGVAIAALATAIGGGVGLYIQRGQLRTAQAQLRAALDQLEAEKSKIDVLGKLVVGLRAMVDAQTQQLAAFRESLKLQAESNEIARADAAIRAAQYQIDNANPIDKATSAVREVVDRGVGKVRGWWHRRRR